MGSKSTKCAALALLTGGMVMGSGCLSGANLQQILLVSAVQQTWEFLLDNDGVFDLFEDGNVAE